ncbi:hypothetical protein ACIP3B_33355 [Streptomyces anulatus]|uniref:hypothetical protein n=1 Tax=Streptomyces anulatus TaxID=1892 RepID=UPI0033FC3386
MAAPREPNARLRETIEAIGCTYEALAKDVRRIAAENGEIVNTISPPPDNRKGPGQRPAVIIATGRS